jgi:hypothetical protein
MDLWRRGQYLYYWNNINIARTGNRKEIPRLPCLTILKPPVSVFHWLHQMRRLVQGGEMVCRFKLVALKSMAKTESGKLGFPKMEKTMCQRSVVVQQSFLSPTFRIRIPFLVLGNNDIYTGQMQWKM